MAFLTFPPSDSRVAAIGECMIEIANQPDGQCRRGFGGDTLNTAVYLARQGIAVSYITRLGNDHYSDDMLRNWREEGIDVGMVAQIEGRLPGLYMITTAADGERSFAYWRNNAPARELFNDLLPDTREALCQFDVVYLSGISLSLFDAAGHQALFALLDAVRDRGGLVVFDGNYRPAGWPSQARARETVNAMLARTDLAVPTFDDEVGLFGDRSPAETVARLHQLGVAEVVVKQGDQGCLISDGLAAPLSVPATQGVTPVDTTAAGDSFNAGYLAARLQGQPPRAAAQRAHAIAAKVICHPGAIIPKNTPLL
jgi:2-dehydro-3-deoxygluconokinase|tara:strand:+ start:193 stop:1128 length:936 start_codon:yes stop_codon:yes gene_type:complete